MAISLTSTGLSGEIRNTTQPAFCVKKDNDQGSPATGATVTWSSERFDQGSDFTSNTFTAPVTGRYFLIVYYRLDGHDQNSYGYMHINTSNINYEMHLHSTNEWDASASYYPMHGHALADMDASDTAYVQWHFNAGNAPSNISPDGYFSGFLVC